MTYKFGGHYTIPKNHRGLHQLPNRMRVKVSCVAKHERCGPRLIALCTITRRDRDGERQTTPACPLRPVQNRARLQHRQDGGHRRTGKWDRAAAQCERARFARAAL